MSIKRVNIKVYDMTCISCESRVERAIENLQGVSNANAKYITQEVFVQYDSDLCDLEKIKENIKSAGYSTETTKDYKFVGIFIIVAAIILIGNSTAGFDMNSKLNGASYFVLFIVGLLTSIHCVGMCGGIMVSQSISKESTTRFHAIIPAVLYNAGRVVSYTIIGGIVGALGSVLSLTLNMKAGLQILAAVFMVIMGLNMAGFSFFRKFNIKLPWSACSIKKKPKSPFLVGILNGLMPCGPLQTMQLYALGTGSALTGALSMFLFSLGTVPLMLTFGAITGLLSKGYTKKILKFSGFLVILLGIIMGSRGLALAGVGIPSLNQTLTSSTSNSSQSNIGKAVLKDGVQEITMTADGKGFTPNAFYVKKNVPVKWIIKGDALNSCNNAIVVPALNIEKTLKAGENIIEFTTADKDINFSCWMGMIRGVIKVTDNLDTVDTSKADSSIPAPSSGMSCCTGNGTTTAAPQKPSIYDDDLSKVTTDRLIRKVTLTGKDQSILIKGIGYEFDPLIIAANKGLNTKLTLDLSAFDNPQGKFDIIDSDSNNSIASFNGQKGTLNISFKLPKSGTYLITKDNSVLAVFEVVDDVSTVSLESIRVKYLNN